MDALWYIAIYSLLTAGGNQANFRSHYGATPSATDTEWFVALAVGATVLVITISMTFWFHRNYAQTVARLAKEGGGKYGA